MGRGDEQTPADAEDEIQRFADSVWLDPPQARAATRMNFVAASRTSK